MKLRRNLVIAAMSLAFMGAGFAGVAVASGGSDSPSGSHFQSTSQGDENEVKGHEGKATESPGDQARQVAACKAAGISPSATNIDYDDQTGVCRLDTGGDEGGDDDQSA